MIYKDFLSFQRVDKMRSVRMTRAHEKEDLWNQSFKSKYLTFEDETRRDDKRTLENGTPLSLSLSPFHRSQNYVFVENSDSDKW